MIEFLAYRSFIRVNDALRFTRFLMTRKNQYRPKLIPKAAYFLIEGGRMIRLYDRRLRGFKGKRHISFPESRRTSLASYI